MDLKIQYLLLPLNDQYRYIWKGYEIIIFFANLFGLLLSQVLDKITYKCDIIKRNMIVLLVVQGMVHSTRPLITYAIRVIYICTESKPL